MKYADLIGVPFEFGGRGPDSYDCWGLLMELQRRRGVIVPDYESPTNWNDIADMIEQEIVAWRECELKPGATILMKVARRPHHVGMYLEFGKFIHTHQDVGSVCVDRINDWKRQIVGYYEFAGNG